MERYKIKPNQKVLGIDKSIYDIRSCVVDFDVHESGYNETDYVPPFARYESVIRVDTVYSKLIRTMYE